MILEQSEKLDGTIVQTVRRADGFEYVRECGPTMLELLIQCGYDASLAHPECFRAFSYVELAERLGVPLTTSVPNGDRQCTRKLTEGCSSKPLANASGALRRRGIARSPRR
jgi:hypothetical protein